MSAKRTIFYSLFFAWIIGFTKTDEELAPIGGRAMSIANSLPRLMGVTTAAIILSWLANSAPKMAQGFAVLTALTAAGFKADAIQDTVGRVTSSDAAAARQIGRRIGAMKT